MYYDEFRSVKGTIKYGDDNFYDIGSLGTSGMYIYFLKDLYVYDLWNYINEVDKVKEKLSDSDKAAFFDNYISAISSYCLVVAIPYDINSLLKSGYDKEDIDFDMIRQYWEGLQYDNGDAETNYWDGCYRLLAQRACDDYSDWLKLLTEQQLAEAVDITVVDISNFAVFIEKDSYE